MTDVQAIAAAVGIIGAGFITFLLKWAWTKAWADVHEKIDKLAAYVGEELEQLSTDIGKKAENAELSIAREQIRSHETEDRLQHGNVLTAIGRLEGKMDALLARRRTNDGGEA